MLVANGSAPSYLSSHSADVFLSEVRPIKLKIEPLRSINVFLDEFLYKLLCTASSLSTDRLRTSLLSLLPTTLGKEALLEAEVELRAYWERTGRESTPINALEDTCKPFHLPWLHKLLRLKCEAYTTLNESDEDPGAEKQILVLMQSAGCAPPKQSLVAPASLYITAILEAICEHIISNVGRVAARDSSRNSATIQDLFVALCEDQSIYPLFKSMKVYEEIDQLSKATKLRKSKSLTRSDKTHAGSPVFDLTADKDHLPSRSRISLEGEGTISRSSAEKTKAIKLFSNGSRSSGERESDGRSGEKTSESIPSNSLKRTGSSRMNYETPLLANNELQREFDDMMRSSATVKVSLTPDRLKSMEVYKQEKGLRGNRQLTTPQTSSDLVISSPSRVSSRRPSLLSVKEGNIQTSSIRSHQANPGSTQGTVALGNRTRSTSATARVTGGEQFSKPPPPAFMQSSRYALSQDSYPGRTHDVQRTGDSLDLDDRSDDDLSPYKTPRSLIGSSRRHRQPAVSAGTRELMNFLAEGPPKMTASMTDVISDGPSENAKLKGSKRLQKMISKLSLSSTDRLKSEDFSKSKPAQTPTRQTISNRISLTNMSSLANRPIPPRPPPPVSPTSSPTPDTAQSTVRRISRSRSGSLKQHNQSSSEISNTELPPPLPRSTLEVTSLQPNSSVASGSNHHIRNAQLENASLTSLPGNCSTTDKVELPSRSSTAGHSPPRNSSSQARSSNSPPCRSNTGHETIPKPYISISDAQQLRRLFSLAQSADECRLLYDMFLAKTGMLAVEDSVIPKVTPVNPQPDDGLEKLLVGVLLAEDEGDNFRNDFLRGSSEG